MKDIKHEGGSFNPEAVAATPLDKFLAGGHLPEMAEPKRTEALKEVHRKATEMMKPAQPGRPAANNGQTDK